MAFFIPRCKKEKEDKNIVTILPNNDFTTLREFHDNTFTGISMPDSYKKDGYTYKKLRLSDYVISSCKYSYTDAIHCPICKNIGHTRHGRISKCGKCNCIIQTYGNLLEIWTAPFEIMHDNGNKRYFFHGDEVSELEYNKQLVFWKLRQPGKTF